MRNTWTSVRRTQSARREARVRTRVEQEMERLPLSELRKARSLTQTRLAEVLRVNQGAISKMEQRSDMYLSTLRSYVEAMGGSLDIRAVFPEGEIAIERLTDVKARPRRKVVA